MEYLWGLEIYTIDPTHERSILHSGCDIFCDGTPIDHIFQFESPWVASALGLWRQRKKRWPL
jgi:hypothetical protein